MKTKFLMIFVVLVTVVSADAYAKPKTHRVSRTPAGATGTVQYSAIGINGAPKTEGGIVITGAAAEQIYADMSLVPAQGDEQEKVGAGDAVVCKRDTSGKAFCTIDFTNVSKGAIEYDCSGGK